MKRRTPLAISIALIVVAFVLFISVSIYTDNSGGTAHGGKYYDGKYYLLSDTGKYVEATKSQWETSYFLEGAITVVGGLGILGMAITYFGYGLPFMLKRARKMFGGRKSPIDAHTGPDAPAGSDPR